jgi:hypothetical protein
MRFHPPSSFPPPSESCGLRAALRAPAEPRDPAGQPKSASHGVLVPHRDISKRRPPLRRESRPSGQVPSSTFLTSSTVYSATCLRGLVSSRCHVQGLPFRGLSLARSRTGFPRPHHALLALSAAACDQRQRPRLQGFAPRANAVSVETGWASTDPRPSWASAPPGLPPAQRGNAFTSPPPSTFTARNPSRLALGVWPLRGLACLESGCRPARAFWPEPPSLLSKSRVRGLVSGGPPSRRTR